MSRKAIDSHAFSLVVCTLGRRVLLVHERKHGQTWYLPAGRVEPAETFFDAARRETKEEAGIDIVLSGIVRVQHSPQPGSARFRVIFAAYPVDDTPPKRVADDESLEAGFFSIEEMADLDLRGPEVVAWSQYVLDGGAIAPLSFLSREGALFGLSE